ncbi:MAG: hypothetical protein LUE87_01885, partial [Lachnospiraceae bacterium]|nr:hypothetical protein [Lachnospiraceae bacterium]
MLTLVFFKLLSDLGVYYTFAGFFAVQAGAEPPALLSCFCLQVFCALLTYLAREKGFISYLLLALLGGCFFLAGNLAGVIAVVPPGVYVAYIAAGKLYVPEYSRQVNIFSLFWKALLGFCCMALLFGGAEALRAVTIPAGLMTLTGCVILTRSLCHDLSVCCAPRYQVMNLATAAGIGGIALVLGSNLFLRTVLSLLGWFYQTICVPILMVFLYLLLGIFQVIIWLFSWVSFSWNGQEQEAVELDMTSAQDLFGEAVSTEGNGELFERVCIALGLILAAAVIAAVFRFLSRRSGKEDGRRPMATERSAVEEKAFGPLFPFSSDPRRQVRQQYRKYLRLCRSRNIDIEKSDTSEEIASKSQYSLDSEAVHSLRKLYIAARYNDQAPREDAAFAR